MCRDIGNAGEKFFASLCDQSGITTNKAYYDKKGWDYLVEIPNENINNNISFDNYPFPYKCLVQVKSSDTNPGKWSIKLSNWRHLILTELPSFYLILEYDNKSIPQRIYLYHIWENDIKKILKVFRGLEKSDIDELNKKSRIFKYNDSHKLNGIEGNIIKDALINYIKDQEKYVQDKIKIIRNVGYDFPRYCLKTDFTVPKSYKDPYDFLVDFSLGLTDGVEIKKARSTEIRFNIEKIDPRFNMQSGGTLYTIDHKPIKKVQVRYKNKSTKETIFQNFDLFIPGGIKNVVDKKYLKVLLKSSFTKIIIGGYKNEIQVDYKIPELNSLYPISELYNFSRLILFLNQAYHSTKEFYLSFQSVGDKVNYKSKMQINAPIDPELLNIMYSVEFAGNICNYLHISNDTKINLKEIINQKTTLFIINNAIKKEPSTTKISFIEKSPLKNNKKIAVPLVLTFELGEYFGIFELAIIDGMLVEKNISETEIRYEYFSDKIKIFDYYYVLKSEFQEIDIELKKAELNKKLSKYFIILLNNF